MALSKCKSICNILEGVTVDTAAILAAHNWRVTKMKDATTFTTCFMHYKFTAVQN